MKYFPQKPASGGMPASESKKMSMSTASVGARGKVCARHGGDGHKDDERHPHRTHGKESPEQYAQQHRPPSSFNRHRHKSGDAGRCAFIRVRSPLMERHGGDFKQQASRRGE